MGDGVGGNMVAAVTLLTRERGGPPIRFQVLFCPVTDADFETPSYRQFAEGPWLTREAMQLFWNSYAPDLAVRTVPTAAPLRTPLEQLQGLPPALVITAEVDVVRDEGEARAQAPRGRSGGDGRAVSRGYSRFRAAQSDRAKPADSRSHYSGDRGGPRCH